VINVLWLCCSLRDSGNALVGAKGRLQDGGNQTSRMIRNLNLFFCTGASTVYDLVYGETR